MIKLLQLVSKIDQEIYRKLLVEIDCTEPHYTLSYLKNFGGGLDHLHCFIFETDTIKALTLSYISPVTINGENTGYLDATSPYGYFGPQYNIEPSGAEIHLFWSSLMEWYSDNNIVSEFVRFSLNGNESGYPGHIVTSMLNVKGEIKDVETLWLNFDRKVRKNVNRALRENLSFKIYTGSVPDRIIDHYYSIYIATMNRTSAAKNFFYSKKNFTDLFRSAETKSAVAMVYHEGVPISAELVLCSDVCFYSFLGGTDNEYFDKRPNDFLKFELIKWARTVGFKYFILGGGYGKEDGIYKYKKSFFPDGTTEYFTGRKIICKKKYLELCKIANVRSVEDKNWEECSYFPSYKIRTCKESTL